MLKSRERTTSLRTVILSSVALAALALSSCTQTSDPQGESPGAAAVEAKSEWQQVKIPQEANHAVDAHTQVGTVGPIAGKPWLNVTNRTMSDGHLAPLVQTSTDGNTWQTTKIDWGGDGSGVSVVNLASGATHDAMLVTRVAKDGAQSQQVWVTSDRKTWSLSETELAKNTTLVDYAGDTLCAGSSADRKTAVFGCPGGGQVQFSLPEGYRVLTLSGSHFSGDRGIVLATAYNGLGKELNFVATTTDAGATWSEVHKVNNDGGDVFSVAVVKDGFLASGTHNDVGHVWHSSSGSVWTTEMELEENPSIDKSIISELAVATDGTESVLAALTFPSNIMLIGARRVQAGEWEFFSNHALPTVGAQSSVGLGPDGSHVMWWSSGDTSSFLNVDKTGKDVAPSKNLTVTGPQYIYDSRGSDGVSVLSLFHRSYAAHRDGDNVSVADGIKGSWVEFNDSGDVKRLSVPEKVRDEVGNIATAPDGTTVLLSDNAYAWFMSEHFQGGPDVSFANAAYVHKTGQEWQEVTLPKGLGSPYSSNRVVHAGGKFHAIVPAKKDMKSGFVALSSTDGITWAKEKFDKPFKDDAAKAEAFCAGGTGPAKGYGYVTVDDKKYAASFVYGDAGWKTIQHDESTDGLSLEDCVSVGDTTYVLQYNREQSQLATMGADGSLTVVHEFDPAERILSIQAQGGKVLVVGGAHDGKRNVGFVKATENGSQWSEVAVPLHLTHSESAFVAGDRLIVTGTHFGNTQVWASTEAASKLGIGKSTASAGSSAP